MKNLSLLVFLILTFFQSFAQLPISWQLGIRTLNCCSRTKSIETADSSIYLFGNSYTYGSELLKPFNDQSDFYVTKLDKYGCLIWSRPIRGGKIDSYIDVIETSNGFLVSAYSDSNIGLDKSMNSFGGSDLWIIKIGYDGNIIWDKSYGGAGDENIATSGHEFITRINDNSYLIGISSSSYKSGNKTEDSRGMADYWIINIDSVGNIKKQKTIGGDLSDRLASINYINNVIYIIGVSDSPISNDKTLAGSGVWIVQLDTNLILKKQILVPSQTYNVSFQSVIDQQGYLTLAMDASTGTNTYKHDMGYGNDDLWLLKLDKDLNRVWDKAYGGSQQEDYGCKLYLNKDNNYNLLTTSNSEISGNKTSPIYGSNDNWLLEIGSNGNIIWQMTLGGGGDEYALDIIPTRDNGMLVLSSSNSPISGNKTVPLFNNNSQYWLVKLHPQCVQRSMYIDTLCKGEDLLINGEIYSEKNKRGTQVLKGSNNCDSILCVSLAFRSEVTSNYIFEVCVNDTLRIGPKVIAPSDSSYNFILRNGAYNGCDSTVNVKIIRYDSLICNGSLTHDNGTANGSIQLMITGGKKPYKVLWNNGSTSSNIQQLRAGTYFVVVTDSLGCQTIKEFVIKSSTSNSDITNLLTQYLWKDENLLELQFTTIDEYHVNIFNIDGKLLLRQSIQSNSAKLDLSPFTSSIYFLSIENSKNEKHSLKIFKNK